MSDRREITVGLSDEALDAIARRVAEILGIHKERERPEPWIGVAEAAQHLHCKPQRIYALVHQRRLRPRREGARLLFRRSELDAWLATGGASGDGTRFAANGIRDGR